MTTINERIQQVTARGQNQAERAVARAWMGSDRPTTAHVQIVESLDFGPPVATPSKEEMHDLMTRLRSRGLTSIKA